MTINFNDIINYGNAKFKVVKIATSNDIETINNKINSIDKNRKNSTVYSINDIAFSPSLPSSLLLLCTTAGTTAVTEPNFSDAEANETVTDGTVVWTYKNILSGDGSGVPVGFIMPYAGTGLAEGFLDCDGSAVSRTMYPDLFAAIGTTWGAGDGSTTFNLPRSEDLVFQGASATNPVGTYKQAGLPNIDGEIKGRMGASNGNTTGAFTLTYDSSGFASGSAWNTYIVDFDASRSNDIYGASDTVQPPAACVRYMIKSFDGLTPSSAGIDLTQYAADLANKANRGLSNLMQDGENHFLKKDFAIIYPNGGSESSPANIAKDSRYVENNPFSGYYVHCVPEVYYKNEWCDPQWWDDYANGGYRVYGTRATQLNDGDIIISTAASGVLIDSNSLSGTGFTYDGALVTTQLPCRVKVWKIGKIPS